MSGWWLGGKRVPEFVVRRSVLRLESEEVGVSRSISGYTVLSDGCVGDCCCSGQVVDSVIGVGISRLER